MSERPVMFRFIKTLQDMDRIQDFEVSNLSKLRQKCQADAAETGCYNFIVLNEGDQYCVWRQDEV